MRTWRFVALLGCALATLSCGGGGSAGATAPGVMTLQRVPAQDRTVGEVIEPGGCVVTGLTLLDDQAAGDFGVCDRRQYRIVTFSLLTIPVDAEILEAAVSFDVVGGEGAPSELRLHHAATLTSPTDFLLGIGPPPTSYAFAPDLTSPALDIVAGGLAHWVEHARSSSDVIEIAVGPGEGAANGQTDSLVLENFQLFVQYRGLPLSELPESP